ncbi:hypothetical protein V500_10297, partial [Pseudogymnoascus sp. VKM F-4518 (FW-2643)]
MSTSSSRSARGSNARRLPRNLNGSVSDRLSRTVSRFMPKVVTYNESYTYALRAAFLHHLLQPRAKRKQYVAAPKAISHRASTIGDLVKDLSGVGSAKSAKLPHGFMGPLEKRMTGVIMMRERLPGYNDPAVKRSFAEAYTAFTEATFRRRMEQERRVEDLVLIFYSNAVKSLQKGKPPGDDSWKNLLDRHVALFLRLLSNTMKDHGYDKDRPELMSRLATLEKKLLTDDQDLSSGAGPSDSYIEVVNPISYDVKDMPMVQVVGRIFGMRNSQVQSDIDANKKFWTEEVALTELKSYQQCINSQSARVLSTNDFDVDEGYQAWKKAESHDLSQMMLDILHVKPELAKSSTANTQPTAPPATGPNKPLPTIIPVQPNADYYNTISSPTERSSLSSFSQTQPADMSGLSLSDDQSNRLYLEEVSFVYIPPDPRAYYRSILMHAATYDQLHTEHNAESGAIAPPLSMHSLELLTELAIRWRVPQFSRLILYLDVSVQRFKDREIGLEELDAAFEMIKNPPGESKKASTLAHAGGLQSIDRSHWTIHDFALYRHTLISVHDSLLRDLYDVLQHCYDAKPPSVGPGVEGESRSGLPRVPRGRGASEPGGMAVLPRRATGQVGGEAMHADPEAVQEEPGVYGREPPDGAAGCAVRVPHRGRAGGLCVALDQRGGREDGGSGGPGHPARQFRGALREPDRQRAPQRVGDRLVPVVQRDDGPDLPAQLGRRRAPCQVHDGAVEVVRGWAGAVLRGAGGAVHQGDEPADARAGGGGEGVEAGPVDAARQGRVEQQGEDGAVPVPPAVAGEAEQHRVRGAAARQAREDDERRCMRRPNKYVFTVKVVEGEDLKACDTNGFSDPYVILGDEFKKRLMKTRVVPKNLNPRWDESIDIIVSGPVNIVATIWDFDTFGDDDLMGRTSLKLDPSHFADYLPKECWLNLDTQGKLLLRIGMEGERDDIQFYFGKAFRLLKRTERDMIRKITDK